MEDDIDDRDDTKRKSRNLSEKKRRDQFNTLVNDLSALISTTNRKMDKSTVLKSTIAFLRHHNEATDRSKVFEIKQEWKPSFLSNDEFTQLMLESLDGFIIVFGSRGPIFYTSDNITAQLGYLPCDLIKKTIFDLAYEMEHENLLNIFLNHKPVIEPLQTDINSTNQITFYVHLKRGDTDDRSSLTYELVKFVGYFRNDADVEVAVGAIEETTKMSTLPRILQENVSKEIDKKLIFVGTGRLQMPQLIREITVIDPTRNEFTSKHSMEWKFLFLDHRAPPIIGYMPFEVLGTSGYDYYHFDDIDDIVACHEELIQSGKGKSNYYRFLTKGQQWIWLQSDFYIAYNQFNAKPDYVVCTHKVVNYKNILKNSHDEQKTKKSAVAPSDRAKSPSSTLGDLESSNTHLDTAPTKVTTTVTTLTTPAHSSGPCSSSNILPDVINNETSLSMDAPWTNTLTPSVAGSSQFYTFKSTSCPTSSYGNISSTGVSPTAKRKRYPYHYRGYDSDSTSISADSGTSKHSLMTHISSVSGRQKFSHNQHQQNVTSGSHHQHNHQQQQQQQQAVPTSTHKQYSHALNQQQQQQFVQMKNSGHQQGQQHKMVHMIPQQHPATTMSGNSQSCQFPQSPFSIRNPQIVAPTFLEPPQYLAAIPVQPVLAPFPVTPLMPTLPHQQDMARGPVIMTSTQSQLQEQLQRKHDELQMLIKQQQDELRVVSDQLLLARYSLLPHMMPVNYNPSASLGNNTRNYNYNTNTVQPIFNQYGLALNPEEMQHQQDQHVVKQLQQNLQYKMHENRTQQQQIQEISMQHSQQHHQQQQQQQQHQDHQQILLNRAANDLDEFAQEEFDAFLNLSPIHSLGGSQTALNQMNTTTITNHTTHPTNHQNITTTTSNTHNNSTINNIDNPLQSIQFPSSSTDNALELTVFSTNQNTSEDSLLSYMQITADSSAALNFPMGINDDGSQTQSEDAGQMTRLHMSESPAMQPTVTQQIHQQRSPGFFSEHNFQSLIVPPHSTNSNNLPRSTNPSPSSNHQLTSDLDNLLPYPITEDIFNPNIHPARNSP